MQFFMLFIITVSLFLGIQGRILFPEELVSFLSFVYSVLPPVKVGKDSRIGAGFRVGQNADFQLLIELGPQRETQPLGPDTAGARETRASNMTDLKIGTATHNTKIPKRTRKRIISNTSNKDLTPKNTF